MVISFPGEDTHITETLKDFSAIFNARIFDEFDSDEITSIQLQDLGKALKVESTYLETFFIGQEKKSKTHILNLKKRISEVETLHNNSTSIEKVLYQNRLDNLSGNMTLIKLGGRNQIEQQEIKDKLIDGLNSVKNSLFEGVLAGGGAPLLHSSKILEDMKNNLNEDRKAGIELMKDVCSIPIKTLCFNAGVDGNYVKEKVLEGGEEYGPSYGFNLVKMEFEDLFESGIVEPVFNARNVLFDAVSVGGMMLTCEVMIVQKERYLPSELKWFPKEIF